MNTPTEQLPTLEVPGDISRFKNKYHEAISRPRAGKWLWTTDPEADHWNGSFQTIDEAIRDAARDYLDDYLYYPRPEPRTVWIAAGRKIGKEEREEHGVEEDVWYQIDSIENAIKVTLPKP